MPKKFFYADGETVDAALDESRSYPRVEFTYTPLTIGEHGQVSDELAAGSGAKIADLARRIIAGHVTRWNVTKPDGSPVDPKKQGEVNRLVPQLVRNVFEVIYDTDAGDLKDAAEPVTEDGLGN